MACPAPASWLGPGQGGEAGGFSAPVCCASRCLRLNCCMEQGHDALSGSFYMRFDCGRVRFDPLRSLSLAEWATSSSISLA